MRQVPRSAALAAVLAALCLVLARPAGAEDIYNLNQNQTGFDLPGVTLPQGQDEVRAADGTSCSSSISGSGAYLDLGVIKNNERAVQQGVATYGRVVIPLGGRSKRLDCTQLYQLELERLRTELQLLKMGLDPDGIASAPQGVDATATQSIDTTATQDVQHIVKVRKKKQSAKNGWVSDGWSNAGSR